MKINIMVWLKSNKLYFSLAVIFLAVFLLSGCDNSKNTTEVKNQSNEQAETKQDAPKESELKKEETKPEVKNIEENQKLSEYTERNKQIKQELINKYHAVDIAKIDTTFSLELTRNIQQNKVFLQGDIKDIFIRKNRYFVSVESSPFAFIFDESVEYAAELECSKEFADYIIKNKIFIKSSNNLFSEPSQSTRDFFAVAEIDDIAKPSYDVSASPISDEEAKIDFESSNLFLLKGRLIDFQLGEERSP